MSARPSPWLTLVAVLLGACHRAPAAAEAPLPDRPPVLIVGLDGFEWDIALGLLREDRLPVIRGLMRRGSFGLLQTRPAGSPVLWTTIATGKRPSKHGVRDFVHPKVSGQPRRLYTSQDRATKAFWNIFSDHGRRVDLVGWWLTYPVEPINGVMVAQANTLEGARKRGMLWKGGLISGLERQIYPSEREASLLAVVDQVEGEMRPLLDRVFGRVRRHPDVQASRWALRADAIYARIAGDLLSGGPMPDVLAVYFGGADVLGHRFWPSSAGPASTPRLGAEALATYYAHLDTTIGTLLARCPADVTVVVLSDHGMGPGGHGNAPDGFLVAAGPTIRPAAWPGSSVPQRSDLPVVGSILDVTPTLLSIAGLPLARDMDGHTMKGLLDPRLLARDRPDPVDSYDTAEWLAARRGVPRARDVDPERLEQLRALGYVQ